MSTQSCRRTGRGRLLDVGASAAAGRCRCLGQAVDYPQTLEDRMDSECLAFSGSAPRIPGSSVTRHGAARIKQTDTCVTYLLQWKRPQNTGTFCHKAWGSAHQADWHLCDLGPRAASELAAQHCSTGALTMCKGTQRQRWSTVRGQAWPYRWTQDICPRQDDGWKGSVNGTWPDLAVMKDCRTSAGASSSFRLAALLARMTLVNSLASSARALRSTCLSLCVEGS